MILITAFDPFGQLQENPSQQVLQAFLADNLNPEVVGEILPTSFAGAGARIEALLEAQAWRACIMLGVAEDRKVITPEAFAVNAMDARIADNDGAQPKDESVVADGPAAYASTLPLAPICEQLNRAGIAANVSYHAGTYVCNATFYRAMHRLAGLAQQIPCGFVHLPPFAAIPLETQVKALEIVVDGVILVL